MSSVAEGGASPRVPGRLAVAVALLGVDLGLRLFGFSRTSSWLAGAPGRGVAERELSADERAVARSLAGVVERAAGFRVYRVPCLPRALLLRHMLAGRGLPARLRIGVRREDVDLHAHAWVVSGAEVLDPDPSVEERFPGLE